MCGWRAGSHAAGDFDGVGEKLETFFVLPRKAFFPKWMNIPKVLQTPSPLRFVEGQDGWLAAGFVGLLARSFLGRSFSFSLEMRTHTLA